MSDFTNIFLSCCSIFIGLFILTNVIIGLITNNREPKRGEVYKFEQEEYNTVGTEVGTNSEQLAQKGERK